MTLKERFEAITDIRMVMDRLGKNVGAHAGNPALYMKKIIDENNVTEMEEIEADSNTYNQGLVLTSHKPKREKEYPVKGDQLDNIWKQFEKMRNDGIELHPDTSQMLDSILATKIKYPKAE